MGDIAGQLEKLQKAADETWNQWRGRADYFHNPMLAPNSWTVDGETQDATLTEDTLDAALLREGVNRKVVEVGAPLHLALGRIIGRTPAYRW